MTDAIDLSLGLTRDPVATSFAGAAGVRAPAPQQRGDVYEGADRAVEPVRAADLSNSGQQQGGQPRQNAATYRTVRLPNGGTGAVSADLPAATLDTLG